MAKDKVKLTSYEGYMFMVHRSRELLAGQKHQEMLRRISALAPIEPEFYEEFYAQLIANYAEFVQAIPMPDSLTPILNVGLERACLALEHQVAEGDSRDQLLAYALFSGVLLRNLGLLMEYYRIDICDVHGIFLQTWSPLGKPMLACGDYYKVRYQQEAPKGLGALSAPILAEKIMPAFGLRWLSEDQDIFMLWLAIITHIDEYAGVLGVVLSGLEDMLSSRIKDSLLPELPIEPLQPVETAIGEAFWQWLKSGLANKDFPINLPNAWVHVVEGGVLLELEELFKEFAKTHPNAREKVHAIKQVKSIGVTKRKQAASTGSGGGVVTSGEKSRQAVINTATFYHMPKAPGMAYLNHTGKIKGQPGPAIEHVGILKSKATVMVKKSLLPKKAQTLPKSKLVKLKKKVLTPPPALAKQIVQQAAKPSSSKH